LEAEIDELKEANSVQTEELRLLRRKLRDAENAPDEVAAAQINAYQAKREADDYKRKFDDLTRAKSDVEKELDAERAGKAEVENELRKELEETRRQMSETASELKMKLMESERAYEELKAEPTRLDEMEALSLRNEVDTLQQSLTSQAADVEAARATIRELEGMLAEKTARESAAFEEEKEELLAEIESLTQELEEAKGQLKGLEKDRALIEDFKHKLETADEARQESEKSIVDMYERKLSLLTLDKDTTIDRLRTELSDEKRASVEEAEEMKLQLKQYQIEVSELREDMGAEIEQREARIHALESTLEAQEQLVSNMKTEMDHLQGSMEFSVVNRRDEIEEMQEEVMKLTSLTAKQEREISSLKLQLDEKDIGHQADVAKLQETISALENRNQAEHRTAADLQMEIRVQEVKDRLEQLKWRNNQLKEENANLRKRLEKAEAKAAANDDTERVRDLQKQLSVESGKVKELEAQVKSLVSPPPAPKPRVPPSPKRSETPKRLSFFGRKRSSSQDVPSEEEMKNRK
jgi:chromosome segregation ATPase